MGDYEIPRQIQGMKIIYVCPDCYGLVMFPMVPPGRLPQKPPLAVCSKCYKTCQNIVGINFGAIHEQERGIQIHPDSIGEGLDPSVESHQSEAEQDI